MSMPNGGIHCDFCNVPGAELAFPAKPLWLSGPDPRGRTSAGKVEGPWHVCPDCYWIIQSDQSLVAKLDALSQRAVQHIAPASMTAEEREALKRQMWGLFHGFFQVREGRVRQISAP